MFGVCHRLLAFRAETSPIPMSSARMTSTFGGGAGCAAISRGRRQSAAATANRVRRCDGDSMVRIGESYLLRRRL